jgi:hypothetical protein
MHHRLRSSILYWAEEDAFSLNTELFFLYSAS